MVSHGRKMAEQAEKWQSFGSGNHTMLVECLPFGHMLNTKSLQFFSSTLPIAAEYNLL